jgi:hypothetical protein
MATRPIDDDAIAARAEIWGTVQSGMRFGMLICVLIFLAVPPIYLFDTFVPIAIGGPLIGLLALGKSVTLLAHGNALGGVYDLTDRAMAPLDLKVTERYGIEFDARLSGGGGLQSRITGAMEMQGDRYGRHVTLRHIAGGRHPSKVTVAIGGDGAFEVRSRDGRLKAADGAPEAVAALVKSLPSSVRWQGAHVKVSGGVIKVDRKSAAQGDSMLDLWLAERIAEALAPAAAGTPSIVLSQS